MSPNDPTPDPFASVPDSLPPHQVHERIGGDRWGELFRAVDIEHNRPVVLKFPWMGRALADVSERFSREARAAAQVRHPHLLPVLAVGLYDGRLCYTTPPTPNGTLAKRREQFHEQRAAAELVEKLAGAASAAHAHGMVHGNLDLAEVLFDESDQPQASGFGLAPFLLSLEADPEAPSAGNPAYFAPEQLTASGGAIEASWDVWSLGLVLYELLTGRHPFAGGTVVETLERTMSADPTSPRRLRPDLDPVLEAVVVRCLEKGPDDRYPSARALAEDLERWRLGEPTVARPPTWTQRVLRALRRKPR